MPSHSGARGRQLTRAAQREFLKQFALGWSVSKSAAAAGVDRRTPYKWREEDPEFAADWLSAEEQGSDRLEDSATLRGVEGWERPVYQGGELVGTTQEYSDKMLEIMLKARRPSRFRERIQMEGTQEVRVIVEGGLPINK